MENQKSTRVGSTEQKTSDRVNARLADAREIKFRGKRKDNGEWIYGNLFVPNKLIAGIWICPETTYGNFYPGLEEGDNVKDYEFDGITLGHFHEVIPETVGQFTGLSDKNREEIYDGDILSNRINCNGRVFFGSGKFKCEMIYKDSEQIVNFELMNVNSVSEIIGNIYENPDLLTK